ncbi:MAG TPA: winged helix DNA-binding domain-containing protein [Actinomycetota bacterium]|nr:winged helix DNA-binding domain-containing protein [Actinomycetota bacterium]
MKPADLTRRRIHSSHLSVEPFGSPVDTVRAHLAMQAQDYAPAKWSIGQRSTSLTHEDVDRALADGSIVRTHVLRPTWHFVAADDLRWLMALSGPRVQQGNARRYGELGLDARTRARCERVIGTALAGGARLTRDQLAEALEAARIDPTGQRMPYILMHCELEALIGSGGLAGKRQTYTLLEGRVPVTETLDRDRALVELTRRYLSTHGPATVKDLSWWSGLTMKDLRGALASLGDEVRSEQLDRFELWSLADGSAAPSPVRGVHLLQTYDEIVVGYTESRFLGDPANERARAAWFDRNFPSGVFLLNGRIGGRWRRRAESKRILVEVVLYEEAKRGHRAAIEKATKELGAFFERPAELTIRSTD